MTNVTDLSKQRQFRTKIEQWTDDNADIGSPAWIERNSGPDPLAERYGHIDPLAANYARHTVDAEDAALESRRAAAIARREYQDWLRRVRAFSLGSLIGAFSLGSLIGAFSLGSLIGACLGWWLHG